MRKLFALLLSMLFTPVMSVSALNETEQTYGYDNIFDSTKDIKVAYLGGSITEGAGGNGTRYSTVSMQYFQDLKAAQGRTATEINAGIGGTPSDLGLYRLYSQILAQKPDVVFVEFAVNDRNRGATAAKNMEGIVRTCMQSDHQPCVIFVISAQIDFDNVAAMADRYKTIADYYNVGFIDFNGYMKSLVDAGEAVWDKDQSGSYTNDNTHPNTEGHQLYGNYIIDRLTNDTENVLKKLTYQTENLNSYVYGEPKLVPHDDSAIKYTGNWIVSEPGARHADSRVSSSFINFPRFSDGYHEIRTSSGMATPPTIEYTFTGRSIGIFADRGDSGASATYVIDQGTTYQKSGSFSNYYKHGTNTTDSEDMTDTPVGSQMACSTWLIEDLTYGEHTLKITLSEPTNKEGYVQDLFAFGYFMVDDVMPSDITIAKDALTYEIALSDAIDPGMYTTETSSVFETALAEAKTVSSNTDSTLESYTLAAENLRNARKNLAYSFAILEKYIKKAEYHSEYVYSPDSYAPLATAVSEAKALVEAGDSSSIDDAIKALTDAMANLKFIGGTVKSSTYLSDMSYTSLNYTGTSAANFRKDKNRSGNTISLIIDGTVTEFSKGIAADAPSTITYAVPEDADTFEAYVGIDYQKVGQGNIIFRVYDEYGDVLSESPALTGSSNAVKFTVPVKGASSIVLENDMNGDQISDWSTWADAKFVTYEEPPEALVGIKINATELEGFSSRVFTYDIDADDYSEVPTVEAVLGDTNATATIITPKTLPGIAVVIVIDSNGNQLTYRINFNKYTTSKYLSDISYSSVTTYGSSIGVDKDRRGNAITVWNEDGTTTTYEKGIGAEASSSTTSCITYDISSYGFDAFEALASISYYALAAEEAKGLGDNPRSSIIYKFYLDEELVYETPLMQCKTPAHKVKFDINGASTLRIEFNANGDQSADWGILADAKFLGTSNGEDANVNLTYTQNDDFTLTVTGFKEVPAANSKMTLIIPETIGGLTVTVIGENAFNENPNNDGTKAYIIQNVVLPDTIKKIEYQAFFDCWALKTINLPEGLISIGSQAFVHASGGLNLTMPSTLKSIGAKAFQYASGAKITLNDGLESIGANAFQWNSISEVIVPDSVTSIASKAFSTCLNLKTFRFPRNDTYNTIVENILCVDNLSAQSIPVEHLYIPDTITTVPDTMFSHFKPGGTCYVYAAAGSAAEAAVKSAMENGKTNGCTLVVVEYDYENEDLYVPVSVTVAGGEFTLSKNGSDAANYGATHTNNYVTGTLLSLTATPEDDNSSFMYWLDASSNKILSTSESYEFILGSSVSLKAVFSGEADYYITFTNANDIVLSSGIASGGVNVPDDPYLAGYVFDGWYLSGVKQSLTAGETLSNATANTNYRSGFKASAATYSVTTVNANEEGASYKYNAKVTVTPKDRTSEGLVFTHWIKNNVTVSYNENYTFYVSEDATVEAVYAESSTDKKNIITITSAQVDSTRLGFYIEYDIIKDYTVIEVGILMGDAAGLEVNTAPIKAVATNKTNKGQYTVRKAKLSAGDTYYGRGYVIYTDGSEIYTIYSDEISDTIK